MKKIVFIALISLAITTNTQAQATPNNGFEFWSTVPSSGLAPAYDQPSGWNSLNSLTAGLGKITCEKTSDAYANNFAIKLITKQVGNQTANGLVTTGNISVATSAVSGGIPYTLRPDSIIGWYKSVPMAGDSAFIEIQLLGAGGNTDTVGYAIFRTPGTAVNTYTRFALAITYKKTDDVVKALWILSSSRDNTTHIVNSTLYVDNLQLGAGTFELSTNIETINTSQLKVGPNPTANNLLVQNPAQEILTIKIYNALGTEVKSITGTNALFTINTQDLPSGIYFYAIMDKNKQTLKASKLIIQQ
jgi:Secretion system C-terminal sorting domain